MVRLASVLALLLGVTALSGCPPRQLRDDVAGGTRASSLDGAELSWDGEVLATGRRTLVVFATTWCDVCRREQAALNAWTRSNPDVRTVLVVSGSRPAAVRAMVDKCSVDTKVIRVVVDTAGTVADRYRVEATPTLVLLDEAGKALGRWHRLSELPVNEPAASENPPSEVRVEERSRELGTAYSVLIVTRRERAAQARRDLQAARQLLRRLEARLSEWRDDSEISRLNRRAATERVALSKTLRTILRGSLHVSELTGGAFDITWAPLGELWGEAERRDRLPSKAAVEAALQRVGWRHLVLDDAGLRFARSGMKLGIAGVAKGWIIDAVFHELVKRGHRRLIVNIGGDLRTAGRDLGGRVFELAIANPRAPTRRAIAKIGVQNKAVATSGGYFRQRRVAGRTVGHILDPRTGWPPPFEGSVTVLTRDAAMADALATGLYVLGPEKGLELARRTPGLDVIYASQRGLETTLPASTLKAPPRTDDR